MGTRRKSRKKSKPEAKSKQKIDLAEKLEMASKHLDLELLNINTYPEFEQFYIILLVALTNLVSSMIIGFAPATMYSLSEDENLTISANEIPLVVCVTYFGALIGSLVAFGIIENGCSNFILFLTLITAFFSWIGTAVLESHLGFFILRLLSGICLPLQSASSMHYLSETLSAEYILGKEWMMTLGSTSGLWLMSIIGMHYSWRQVAWAASLICFVAIFLTAPVECTPFYIYRRKDWPAAFQLFERLYGSGPISLKKFLEMTKLLNSEQRVLNMKRSFLKQLFSVPLYTAIFLYIGQELTGISIYLGLLPKLLKDIGFQNFQLVTVITFLFYSAVSVFFLRLRELYQRKYLLTMSSLCIGVFSFLLSMFLFIKSYTELPNIATITFIYACIIAILSSYCYGWLSVPYWVYIESFPYYLKYSATASLFPGKWLITTLVVYLFCTSNIHNGFAIWFGCLGILSILCGVLVEIFMKETFGLFPNGPDDFILKTV